MGVNSGVGVWGCFSGMRVVGGGPVVGVTLWGHIYQELGFLVGNEVWVTSTQHLICKLWTGSNLAPKTVWG